MNRNKFYFGCSSDEWEIKDFDLKDVEDCLKNDSSWVNENFSGNTILTAALAKKYPVDLIEVLLRYGADVNIEDENNKTPLIVALEYSRDEAFISLLLEYGANVLHICRTQSVLCKALSYSASKGVIQLLLDAGCPLDRCGYHSSALFCAVIEFPTLQKDVLQLLIERGADVNAINADGSSVLCFAIQQTNDESSIEVLCAAGIPLRACTNHASPLHCATNDPLLYGTRFLTTNLTELLLSKSTPFGEVRDGDYSPLQGALVGCIYDTGAIDLLLRHFPDVNVVDRNNNNLLHLALGNILHCDPIIVELLIQRGVNIKSINKYGETPLHVALLVGGPLRVIKLLIKNGAPVNAEDHQRYTPLELSVNHMNLSFRPKEKIRVLLAAGAHLREVQNRQSLLEKVFSQHGDLKFESSLLSCFEILLQYNFLKYPNFNIEGMIEGRKDYVILSKYWKECVGELQKMESVIVGENCTLREFLNTYSTPSHEVTNCDTQVEKYDYNQLLRIKANNTFPRFHEVISDKVGRWFMEAKLPEMQIYTVKCHPHKACPEEKIILPYLSVCKIVEYLVDDDLLRLIAACTFMDEHACKDEQEMVVGGKEEEL